jgi:RNA-directed DNA polymerase
MLLVPFGWMRLRKLVRIRKGRTLRVGEMASWTRKAFHELGVHKLLGTIRYPGRAQVPRSERPPVSRVRESRTHSLNGGSRYTEQREKVMEIYQ